MAHKERPAQNPLILFESPRGDDMEDMLKTIKEIGAFRNKLKTRSNELTEALRPDKGMKHKALEKVMPWLPGFLKDRVSISPLGILEGNARSDYNQLAGHMAKLAELAQERIMRHETLQQLVDDAKAGTVSLSEIADQMRETVVASSGLSRIPLVEKLIATTIDQLSPDMKKQREAETLQSLQMILDLTAPLVQTTNAGLRIGSLTLDNLARTLFITTEIRHPLDVIDAMALNIADGSVHVAQAPALIANQMNRAIEGLGLAFDAAQLANDVSIEGKMNFLKSLNEKAAAIAERTNLFLAPPASPDARP